VVNYTRNYGNVTRTSNPTTHHLMPFLPIHQSGGHVDRGIAIKIFRLGFQISEGFH